MLNKCLIQHFKNVMIRWMNWNGSAVKERYFYVFCFVQVLNLKKWKIFNKQYIFITFVLQTGYNAQQNQSNLFMDRNLYYV